MSRVFIENFEAQNLNLWDSITSNCSVVSTTGLSFKGDYCVYITDYAYHIEKNVPAKLEYYFSFLFRLDNTSCYIINLLNDGSTIAKGSFSNNKLEWIQADGGWYNHGDSNISYVLHTTYFMQIYIKISNTSSGRIYVKANGVFDRDSTGSLKTSSAANRIRFGGKAHYDNIVMDDSTMPEETEIVLLRPNGVGYCSDWSTSSSGDNYTFVDEVPYNDSDYVASGIVNAIDTYTLEDLPSNARSVKCVQIQARARKEADSPLEKFNFIVRNSSTNYHSDDVTLSENFSTYYTMSTDGPTGSGIWYPPSVNVMEVGVRTRA